MPNPSSKALPGAAGADAQPADLAEAGAGGGSGADLAEVHGFSGHTPAAIGATLTVERGIRIRESLRHCNPLKQKPLKRKRKSKHVSAVTIWNLGGLEATPSGSGAPLHQTREPASASASPCTFPVTQTPPL